MGLTRAGLSEAPERLTDADRAALRAWAAVKAPHAMARLLDLEEACLDHFRANGKRMKDWQLTVRNWIRRERMFMRQYDPPPRPQPTGYRRPYTTEEYMAAAARREQHRSGLRGGGES